MGVGLVLWTKNYTHICEEHKRHMVWKPNTHRNKMQLRRNLKNKMEQLRILSSHKYSSDCLQNGLHCELLHSSTAKKILFCI